MNFHFVKIRVGNLNLPMIILTFSLSLMYAAGSLLALVNFSVEFSEK